MNETTCNHKDLQITACSHGASPFTRWVEEISYGTGEASQADCRFKITSYLGRILKSSPGLKKNRAYGIFGNIMCYPFRYGVLTNWTAVHPAQSWKVNQTVYLYSVLAGFPASTTWFPLNFYLSRLISFKRIILHLCTGWKTHGKHASEFSENCSQARTPTGFVLYYSALLFLQSFFTSAINKGNHFSHQSVNSNYGPKLSVLKMIKYFMQN